MSYYRVSLYYITQHPQMFAVLALSIVAIVLMWWAAKSNKEPKQ